jgi:single-stranded DNA-binding protein
MSKIEIESAFVESWTKNTEHHPAWGMKTAEPHSRKNEDGKYETVGRTFRTIKVGRDAGIDLTVFRKGDRVHVWGSEVTVTREHEGKNFYDLVVWADRVELVGSRSGAVPVESAEPWGTPAEYTDSVPF